MVRYNSTMLIFGKQKAKGALTLKNNEIEVVLNPLLDGKRSLWWARGGVFIRGQGNNH